MTIYFGIVLIMFISANCFPGKMNVASKMHVDVEYSYYANGKLEFSAEYVNGKLDGLSKHWSEMGYLISETQYSNGKLHGFWKKYYSNKNILYVAYYSHGKKHGKEKWYHENGQLKSEQSFNYGISQEDMIRWNSDGSIIY